MDSFAISVSHGLQYGVPLKHFVKTLKGTAYAPAGLTDDPDLRTATSITDYIFRRLALDYLSFDDRLELGLANLEDMNLNSSQTSLIDDRTPWDEQQETVEEQAKEEEVPIAKLESVGVTTVAVNDHDAPLCYNCGNITQRAGSCYVCTSCGSTTGCS